MSKKLYVGNLSYDTTEDSLEKYFSEVGKVEAVNIITFRDSGKSKGFGFVEMSSEDEAKKAIEMFNEKDFEGRTLKVNEARPKE